MKHRISTFLILACIVLPVLGQNGTRLDPKAVEERNSANRREVLAAIRGTDLKTGVTELQAEAIARLYFQSFISGCGYAEPPVAHGDQWHVTPRIGVAGTPDPNPIIIEKHTGRVSWRRGPIFANLAALLKSAP